MNISYGGKQIFCEKCVVLFFEFSNVSIKEFDFFFKISTVSKPNKFLEMESLWRFYRGEGEEIWKGFEKKDKIHEGRG